MTRMDLNGDVGEDAGPETDEQAFLVQLTSCNVACGFHAGDPPGIIRTVRTALAAGVGVGAHPSWPDRAGFGRRHIEMSLVEVPPLVAYQVSVIKGITEGAGGRLHHVKLHGALYNTAAADVDLARAAVEGILLVAGDSIVYAPPDSALEVAARDAGLGVMREAFADRMYETDGRLVDRGVPGAVLDDPDLVATQAVEIACEGRVRTRGDTWLPIRADTLCFHGDRPGAAERVRSARGRLSARGVVFE